jgi:hypothetical protein
MIGANETGQFKVYLDEPIVIKGIKIGHTKEGLKYLIEHNEHILKIATAKQLGDTERQHIQLLIVNYKQHLALYNSINL